MLFNDDFFNEEPPQPNILEQEFTPNIKDKRVISRLDKALKGVVGLVDKHGICNHSSRTIDNVIGKSSNPLSKWLKDILFVTTRDFYDPDNKICKERKLNGTGYTYIKGLLDGSISLTWKQYKDHIEHQDQVKNRIKLSKISAKTLNVIPLEDALLYCENLYGEELRSGKIVYSEKSNRLWHKLQSIPSEIRNKFLAINGFIHNYDINCCNITLLTQYARRCNDLDRMVNKGSGKKIPVFNDGSLLKYMRAKKQIREQIAKDLNVNVDLVKEVITSILNGAMITGLYSKMKVKLGTDLAYAFDRHPEIKALKKGISSCWQCITSYDDRRKDGFKTINGKLVDVKNRLTPKQKAAYYFELENTVLASVNEFLITTDNTPYLIHDGWITRKLIDIYELRKFVKNNTGFDVEIDHNVLSN